MKRKYSILFRIAVFFAVYMSSTLVIGQDAVNDYNDPAKTYAYINSLLSRKFYDLALPELERLKENCQGHPVAENVDLAIIDCYFNKKDYARTLVEIDSFSKRWGKDKMQGSLWLISGICHYYLQEYVQAEQDLLKVDDESEKIKEAAEYQLAMVLLKQDGRGEEAMTILNNLAAKSLDAEDRPSRLDAAYYLAKESHDKFDIEQYDRMAKQILASSQVTPEMKADLYIRYGDLYCINKEFSKSMYWYTKFVMEFPDNARCPYVAARVIKCQLYLQNYVAVIDLCNDWYAKYHTADVRVEVVEYHAIALESMQQFEDALVWWNVVNNAEAATSKQRENSAFHELICLEKLNRGAEYIDKADTYVTRYPMSVSRGEVMLKSGNFLLNLGQPEEAAVRLSSALEYYAGEPESFFVVGQLQLRALRESGNWRNASNLARRLAKTEGVEDRAFMWYQSAQCLKEIKDFEGEEEDLLMALKQPNLKKDLEYKILANLVENYYRRQYFDKMVPHLQRMVEICPQDQLMTLLNYQVMVYNKLGDYQNEMVVLEKIMNEMQLQSQDNQDKFLYYLNRLLMVSANNDNQDMIEKWLPVVCANFLQFCHDPQRKKNLMITERYLFEKKWGGIAEPLWQAGLKYPEVLEPSEQLEWIVDYSKYLLEKERAGMVLTILGDWLRADEQARMQNGTKDMVPQIVFSLLAEASMDCGEYAGALVYADRALEPGRAGTDFSFSEVYYVKANIYFNVQKNYEQAASCAIRCAFQGNAPEFSRRALEIAADSYEALGDKERAEQLRREIK